MLKDIDLSIKQKATEALARVKSQAQARANAALNNLLGGYIRIGENDVFEILDKVEEIETETNYGYSQQKGIGQKPIPVATGEELKKYSLNIKLHFEYCNPDSIIKRLKEKAEDNEIFSYFQENRYIGEFVIERIHERILNRYQGVILVAEITVDLLEYPIEFEENFEQQTKFTPSISNRVQTVSEKGLKTAIDVVKANSNSIFDTLTEKMINKALRNAESYVNATIGGTTGGIL